MLPTLIVAEPRGAWDRRPPLVVDASVMAALVFDEPSAEEVRAWMLGHRLCVPALLGFELANVARQKVRRGSLSPEIARAALEVLASIELDILAVPPEQAFALAQHYGLSAYDAAYLWLAAELGAPLATYDAQLGQAARIHLGNEPPQESHPST